MKTLLVTGGAGFIGTNFVYYWQDKYPDDRILVLDALTYAGNSDNLSLAARTQANFRFVHGDIRDMETVVHLLESESIDTIVHFAAESHVDRSISGPDAFIETNIIGTHSLLKAAKKVWIDGGRRPHRFHHVSTDEVYGSLGTDDPPFSEKTPYAPNSPYAASKASSDHLVRAYHETFGLDVTTSNCSNNYGPYQFPEKLIPLMVTNILRGIHIPVYGDGQQTRDWLFVDDHNLAVDLIVTRALPGKKYNIGGNNERVNIDIVQRVCKVMDILFDQSPNLTDRFPDAPQSRGLSSTSLIRFVEDRAGHDRRYAIDATRISEELGFSPGVPFETGVERTIRWYLKNEAWWTPLIGNGLFK